MSRKQKQHLAEARKIKAEKHKKIKTSGDALDLINKLITNIDLEKVANSNSASNTLNALINYQKLLKESEAENNKTIREPITVYYCSPSNPTDELRIKLIEREVCDSLGKEYNDGEEKEIIKIMRDTINAYNDMLSNYDQNNNLITDTKTALKVVEAYDSMKLTAYTKPEPFFNKSE